MDLRVWSARELPMSCKQRRLRIQKEILGIKNLYPQDDLILSYKDFLNKRELLPFFQFNPEVFNHLVSLALNKWKSRERINRLSLLEAIKRYSNKSNDVRSSFIINKKISKLDYGTRKKLFLLYKTIWEHPQFIRSRQLGHAQKLANFILINIPLEKEEETWLCDNYVLDQSILNRLLRYPKLSSSITEWCLSHYNENKFRSRRAELVSFILDRDPEFEVDEKTIWQDFIYQNDVDRNNVEEFKNNVSLYHLLQNSEDQDVFSTEGEDFLPYPQFEIPKRFYPVPTYFSEKYYKSFPDFDELQINFKENISSFRKTTMLWAIGYSRLSIKKKSQLLKRNYSEEVEGTFLRICKKYSLLEPLEWLLQKQ